MKSTGIVRSVDGVGRIVIPKELRESMDIKSQESVEIYTENQDIIIKKHKITCIFCGSSENIVEFETEHICKDCMINIINSKEEAEYKKNESNGNKFEEGDLFVLLPRSISSNNLFLALINS